MERRLEIKIVEMMIMVAEDLNREENPGMGDAYLRNLKIRAFKPTLADRLLFEKVVEENKKEIQRKYNQIKREKDKDAFLLSYELFTLNIGFYLLATFFSKYGYDKIGQEKYQ